MGTGPIFKWKQAFNGSAPFSLVGLAMKLKHLPAVMIVCAASSASGEVHEAERYARPAFTRAG
jgi:hypothetical protein